MLERWNSHDIDGLLAVCHPGVRFRSLVAAVEGSKEHRGHEEVRQWWDEVETIFSDRRMECDAIWTQGEWVVFDGTGIGTGRASLAEVRWPFRGVARASDGKLTEVRLFAEPDEADVYMGDDNR
jgi:ketosteroid isomerase-like protein